ncbi:hypothetical protein D3C76_1652160 [compost metagenome]
MRNIKNITHGVGIAGKFFINIPRKKEAGADPVIRICLVCDDMTKYSYFMNITVILQFNFITNTMIHAAHIHITARIYPDTL